MRNAAKVALVILSALVPVTAVAQSRPSSTWIEVRTERTAVVSDAGERVATELLRRIEDVRNTIQIALGKSVNDLDEGLVVMAPRDVEVMRALVGDAAKRNRGLLVAASLPAPYSHHLAVRAGTRESRRDELLMHEYLHRITQANIGDAPAWLDEGLSEFWSTLRVDGDQVRVGGSIGRHAGTLQSQRLIPLAELTQLQRGRYDQLGGRLGLFYAQSWALVHYLMSRDAQPTYAPRVPEDLAALQKSFEAFVRAGRFEAINLPLSAATVAVEFAPTSRAVSESEAFALLGHMAVYGQNREAGLRYADRALQLRSDEALALEVKGVYYFLSNRADEAREWLKRAVEHPAASYRAHYYYAVLNAGTPVIAESHLKRALQLKPGFKPALERLKVFTKLHGLFMLVLAD